MSEAPKNIPHPNIQVQQVKTEVVPIQAVTATPTTIHLSDGSILQLTPQVGEVRRANEEKDANGNPIYLVTSQNAVSLIRVGSK